MFTKLLKHEWRATKGIIGLLCIIILISGVVIGGVMNYMIGWDVSHGDMANIPEATSHGMAVEGEWGDGSTVEGEWGDGGTGADANTAVEPMSDFAAVMCVLLVMAGVMAVAVCGAGSVFFVVYRFYKSRFTDEGYLTFTLPVTNHQLLLSSILNSIAGVFVVILAAFAAIAIAVLLFLLAFPENIIWADVWVSTQQVMEQLWESLSKNAGEFALLAFSMVTSAVAQLIVLMLSVTIGAVIARKHKILAAVGVYYGISFAQSLVSTMFAFTVISTEDVQMVLGFPGLLSVVTAAAGYLLMYYLTSRKLNLT